MWRTNAAAPQIDTEHPVVYRHVSFTRFGGAILTQLNYSVWLPERPRHGRIDLEGGHLDGITWRVTLDRDGRPLLYDAMHNCGCYHLFYPTARVALREAESKSLQEPPLAPQRAPALVVPRGLGVRLAAGTHYVQRVGVWDSAPTETVTYTQEDADRLRSLPTSTGGRHSLYGEDGIVPGTQRTERFVLWPMGVPNPGEMRQWGHHAIAFVGRRHFDDADLVDSLFERVGR